MRKSLSSFVIGMSLVFGGVASAKQMPAPPQGESLRAPMPAQESLRDQVRNALGVRRSVTLQRLLAYREARVYPKNPATSGGAQHIWRDADGHLCAAATIISGDWGVDGTVRAAKGNLHLKIADQKTGPLADWILTSGLTKHELVAIQVPAMPMPDDPIYDARQAEIERLYNDYVDVERQINALYTESLDEAVDALMAHPELARQLVAGTLPAAPPPRQPTRVSQQPSSMKFAQPPPG